MAAGLRRSKHGTPRWLSGGTCCAARGSSVAGGAIRSSTRSALAIPEVDGPHSHVTISLEGCSGGAYSDLAEPPFQGVGPMVGAVHPGLEPAVRGTFAARAPGDILTAKAPAVAVATEALAWAFVAALGVVREVIAPDHVHRVGPGSLLELRVYAQTREPTAGTFPVVQAQHGLR